MNADLDAGTSKDISGWFLTYFSQIQKLLHLVVLTGIILNEERKMNVYLPIYLVDDNSFVQYICLRD